MAGSDLPPSVSASSDTPPKWRVPPQGRTSRKRKRGADAAVGCVSTRSSSSRAEPQQVADDESTVVDDEGRVPAQGRTIRKRKRGADAAGPPVRCVSTRSSSSRAEPQQVADDEATVDDEVWLQRRVTRRCQAAYVDADAEEVLPRRVPRSLPLSQLLRDTPRLPTRSAASSSSSQAVDETTAADAVRMARSVAVGTPWERSGAVDGVEVERMREMILVVRQALSVNLERDDPHSPYAKKRKIYRSGLRSSVRIASQINNLPGSPNKRKIYRSGSRSSVRIASQINNLPGSPNKRKIYRSGSRSSQRIASQINNLPGSPNKCNGTDPVEHLALAPEGRNTASEEDTADHKSETFLQKLGTEAGNEDVDTIDEASDENTEDHSG